MNPIHRILAVVPLLALLASAPGTAPAAGPPEFVLHRLGTFRSEACGVGDFNADGKPDIVAGEYLYLAPDWRPVKIRTLRGAVDDQGKGYNYDFMNEALDVDGDGRLDLVTCSWHEKQVSWLRNVGVDGAQWPETVAIQNGNYETGELWDVDGDGKRAEILPAIAATAWYEIGRCADGKRGLVEHVVSDEKGPFGVGAGDINGDGRPDLIRPHCWWEAPADLRGGAWKRHPLCLGNLEGDKPEHTGQIHVWDFDGDGRNDLLASVAHKYGIFWYRQLPAEGGEPRWERHVIDRSWSQAHAIALADLDGDGDMDFVTGKRFMAHNGKDPGAFEPPGVYWYELKRGPAPEWVKHALCCDQGIGAGLNIPVADIDGDGDLDIVVTGKWGGPAWFENRLK